nr:immunoglobulin light chain junction region [Macaca mulatta]
CQQHNSYPPTL